MKLDKLHDILFGLLCAIDDACAKEGVSYSLGGGTMLGAIRHHDFIPWDDDADICIWREDFPAFKRAMEKHLPPYYRLVEPEALAPNFYDFVPRVQDTRYYWHEPVGDDDAYEGLVNRVCVDIFFTDNSANTLAGVRWFAFQQKVIYGLARGHRPNATDENYTFVQKAQIRFLSRVGRLFPAKTLCRWHDRVSRRHNGRPCKYCMVTNDLPVYLGLPYEREWFVGTVRVPFRDRMLPVQSGYDPKMRLQYGDYMTPPKDPGAFVKHLDVGQK